jgi:hypothetical protein
MPGTQPFPLSGPLNKNLNSSLNDIRRIDAKLQNLPVYAYVVTTVKNFRGYFGQTETAPNFQGNCITLCTCKHKDRASSPPQEICDLNAKDPWQHMWVAGLCSRTIFRPRPLFYLMLVEASYVSNEAIWHALGKPVVKSAHQNIFGDIYEPRTNTGLGPWSESNYEPHLPTHRHNAEEREYDIERTFWNRHPRLLSGDPEHSYLWWTPSVCLNTVEDNL